MVESQYKLTNTPKDGISAVKFLPQSSQYLLASSWDSTVRLYDVTNNTLMHQYSHNNEPVLDCVGQDKSRVFSGGLDTRLVQYDFATQSSSIIGKHDNAIRCLDYWAEKNIVISGSWDATVGLWDPRSNKILGSYATQEQVFTMNQRDELLVVGTAGRKIITWDLRNMGRPVQQRHSLLNHQTRCLRIFPNKKMYALSSVEGRVAVQYFDPNQEIQRKNYTFNCHRIKEPEVESVHPVNAISFHEGYGTFATGGSEGYVCIWDGFNKKRICQLSRYPTGISSLSFSAAGTILAIACSYQYELEEKPVPIPEDCIFIRCVPDQNVKPKQM